MLKMISFIGSFPQRLHSNKTAHTYSNDIQEKFICLLLSLEYSFLLNFFLPSNSLLWYGHWQEDTSWYFPLVSHFLIHIFLILISFFQQCLHKNGKFNGAKQYVISKIENTTSTVHLFILKKNNKHWGKRKHKFWSWLLCLCIFFQHIYLYMCFK